MYSSTSTCRERARRDARSRVDEAGRYGYMRERLRRVRPEEEARTSHTGPKNERREMRFSGQQTHRLSSICASGSCLPTYHSNSKRASQRFSKLLEDGQRDMRDGHRRQGGHANKSSSATSTTRWSYFISATSCGGDTFLEPDTASEVQSSHLDSCPTNPQF
jgi:hypothetical protein